MTWPSHVVSYIWDCSHELWWGHALHRVEVSGCTLRKHSLPSHPSPCVSSMWRVPAVLSHTFPCRTAHKLQCRALWALGELQPSLEPAPYCCKPEEVGEKCRRLHGVWSYENTTTQPSRWRHCEVKQARAQPKLQVSAMNCRICLAGEQWVLMLPEHSTPCLLLESLDISVWCADIHSFAMMPQDPSGHGPFLWAIQWPGISLI